MKIRLRSVPRAAARPVSRPGAMGDDPAPRMSQRRFLGMLAGAAGLAGLAHMGAPARLARAEFLTGDPHRVTGNLQVEGWLRAAPYIQMHVGQGHGVLIDDGAGTQLFGLTRQNGNDLEVNAYQGIGLTTNAGNPRGSAGYRLYADAYGNVGIGTAIPTARLDVAGSARVGGDATVAGTLRAAPYIRMSVGQGHGILIDDGAVDQLFGLTRQNANDLEINAFQGIGLTTNAGSPRGPAGYRLYVAPSGYVGVGTASPQTKLHLADGALRIGGFTVADGQGSFYAP